MAWHREVVEDLADRLGAHAAFPCVFSRNAFRKGMIKYLFVEAVDPAAMQSLAGGLRQYVEASREWDGRVDSAHPLIVAFSLEAVRAETVEAYHSFGWRVLQMLHEMDAMPWPCAVPTDTDSPQWTMCFAGMQLFVNMSCPAHVVRKSRNLGAHFILVINPRERFDVVAGDDPCGRRVRSNIRSRIYRYDGLTHAPQLSSYSEGATEWRQYGLHEDNLRRLDQCPFRPGVSEQA
jgi:N-omega-hydroxy-L-arginine synthase